MLTVMTVFNNDLLAGGFW